MRGVPLTLIDPLSLRYISFYEKEFKTYNIKDEQVSVFFDKAKIGNKPNHALVLTIVLIEFSLFNTVNHGIL